VDYVTGFIRFAIINHFVFARLKICVMIGVSTIAKILINANRYWTDKIVQHGGRISYLFI